MTRPNANQRAFSSDRTNRDTERSRRNRLERARERDSLEAMRQHQRDLRAAAYERMGRKPPERGETT